MRFSDAMRVLALAFDAAGPDLVTLRGRVHHLRKAGASGLPASGKGRQLTYTMDDLRLLYLALRLNQHAIAPEAIARLIERERRTILGWFHRAEKEPDLLHLEAWVQLATFGEGARVVVWASDFAVDELSEKEEPALRRQRLFDRQRINETDKPAVMIPVGRMHGALSRAYNTWFLEFAEAFIARAERRVRAEQREQRETEESERGRRPTPDPPKLVRTG